MLTLREKTEQLLQTVAIPTREDWRPYEHEEDERIITEANAILLKVLEECKAGKFKTWGEIAEAVYGPLEKLEDKYQVGLQDSEGCQTVALFFAINYHPSMYDFLRYWSRDLA